LDGEWTNPTSTGQSSSSTYPSGNGTAGGNFLFRFNVLPADTDQNGIVDNNDLGQLLKYFNRSGGWAQGDTDSNGTVDNNDLGALLQNFNKALPSGEPTAGSFPAVASFAVTSVPAISSGTKTAVPAIVRVSGSVTTSQPAYGCVSRSPPLVCRWRPRFLLANPR